MPFIDGGTVKKLAPGAGTTPAPAPAQVDDKENVGLGAFQPELNTHVGGTSTSNSGPLQTPDGNEDNDLVVGPTPEWPKTSTPGEMVAEGTANQQFGGGGGPAYMTGYERMNDPRGDKLKERQGGPNVGAHGPNQPTNAPKSQGKGLGPTPKGGAKFPTGRPAFQPGKKGK